ncbi:hypothetical protein [Paractinoplanes durhamensis]|uniref:hypothetical protein n=1 Tax=Paractinoplanes durhamensis TaxID=113563 RepID=UPI00362B7196
MRNIGYKSVRLAVAATTCVALAAPVPALASPATSAPAGATASASTPALAPVAVAPRPKRLTAALLAPNDLPRGYELMADGGGLSMMADINTDADICDQKIAHSAGAQSSEAAGVAFTKAGGGPMLFESLARTGPRAAHEIVTGVASAARRCPTVLVNMPTAGQQIRLNIAPLRVPASATRPPA